MKISERKYNQNNVFTFSNTKGKFGGLSNMAPGYSLFVNEINIPNSEALYQACRFPLFPELQEEIIAQKSPMDSKRISRAHSQYTRQDWDLIKFDVMRWCLKVKFVQNKKTFGGLLENTKDKDIVEFSTKDKIWAATPCNGFLVGKNALGRLLMELRKEVILKENKLEFIPPLNIPAFLLYATPISKVYPPEVAFEDLIENQEFELA